jgi:hypothetical protein
LPGKELFSRKPGWVAGLGREHKEFRADLLFEELS